MASIIRMRQNFFVTFNIGIFAQDLDLLVVAAFWGTAMHKAALSTITGNVAMIDLCASTQWMLHIFHFRKP